MPDPAVSYDGPRDMYPEGQIHTRAAKSAAGCSATFGWNFPGSATSVGAERERGSPYRRVEVKPDNQEQYPCQT